MSDNIVGKLKDLQVGEVLADPKSLRRYSRDMSIYQVKPRAIVVPRGIEEISKTILFASSVGVPITPRGGGSGTAGSALGGGIIIAAPREGLFSDISLLSQDSEDVHFAAGAGAYHAQVQKKLKHHGFFLPADPSSSAICQIGGNVSTKASGPHALKYGSISNYLDGIEFISDQGEFVSTMREETIPDRLSSKVIALQQKIQQDQQSLNYLKARKALKTASGYNLFCFTESQSVNTLISQLFTGSVGTLGFISKVFMRGVRFFPERGTMLICFQRLAEAVQAAGQIRQQGAAAVELISRQTLQLITRRTKGSVPITGDGHTLLVEFEGQGLQEQLSATRKLIAGSGYKLATKPIIAEDASQAGEIWKLRKNILPLLANPGPNLKALSVINDVGVPPEVLAEFIDDLEEIFARFNLESIVYGHAGSGNLHLRPLFDMQHKNIKQIIRQLADEVYGLVLEHGGTISGEHGMGRLRAPYLKNEWGETLYGYMREVKQAFDPGNIFNPDVMFSDNLITDNMREDIF